MTVRGQIIAGFTSVLFVVAAFGAWALYELLVINHHEHELTHDCIPGLELAAHLESSVKDEFICTWEFASAHSDAERNAVQQEMTEASQRSTKFFKDYEAFSSHADEKTALHTAEKAHADFLALRRDAIFPLCNGKDPEAAIDAVIAKLDPAYRNLIQSTHALIELNEKHAHATSEEVDSAVASAWSGTIIGLILAVAVSIFVAWFVSSKITRSLSSVTQTLYFSAEQGAAASTQVAAASQALAASASEQASSLEETSASLEELSSMTRQNSDTAMAAKTLASQSTSAAGQGIESMQRMTDAITKIKSSADQTAKILRSIDEIAFQTNLLALNAAVEAARAGEAGKGFAVVAEEVRNLAQRSAEAAKNTAVLIEESLKNADNGVQVSNAVGASLSEIHGLTGKLSQLVNDVANASTEQSHGIAQINTAVSQMDQITQSNAASAEESSSASEELSAQAREMEQAVAILVQMIGGQSATKTYSTPPEKPKVTHQMAEAIKPALSHKRNRTKPTEKAAVLTADDF